MLLASAPPITLAQSYTWRTVEIGGTGFVTGTVFHPTESGLVYARTDVGGAYRLDTATNRWIALNDDVGGTNNEFQHLGVLTIGLDPSDTNRVYIATGQYAGPDSWKLQSRIYRSTDRGATWAYTTPGFKMAGNGEGRGTGERMAVDPLNGANILVGSNDLGIWRSTNHGANWTRLANFPSTLTNLNFLLYAPATAPGPGLNRRVYAAANTLTGQSFWYSDNNGDTWAEVANHPGKSIGTEMMPLQGSFDAAGVFYSTWGDQTGPGNYATDYGVWKMSADGTTWTKIQPPTGQGFFGGISADPQVAGHVVVSTLLRWWPGDEVYRSTDGGTTWTAALRTGTRSNGNSPWASTAGAHWMTDIDIDPFNSNRAIFNTGFGLFQTTNLATSGTARTWTFFNDGLEESVPLGLHSPTAGPPLVSVIGDYTGFRHDDLNRSPLRGGLNPGSGSTSVITGADIAPSKMIRQNSGTTLYSQDTAATWAAFPTTPAPVINGHNRVILSTDGLRLLWCPPNSPAYVSTDNGATWTVSANTQSLTNSNNTQTVGILAGAAGTPGTTNSSGGNARFNSPTAIALDSAGVRYVADTANHTIRKIATNGGVSTFAGGAGVPGSTDNTTGTAARFNSPAGLAVDAAKNAYVADTGNHTIRKITAAGAVTTLAGTAGTTGTTDATGTAARFSSPAGLAADASGNIYVCDAGNHTIRKITSAGAVTTLAGSPGVSGTTNANGGSARFNSPNGITLDTAGNLYVADSGNHAIRKIATNGDVTTFAGLAGTSGSTDATTTSARFNTPKAIAIDAVGTFHIVDSGNHTVRKITSAGVVTTVAGLAGTSGSTNGAGTTARFNNPTGIAATPDGLNIYVADTANHIIRRNTLYNTLTPLADRVDGQRLYLWDGTQKRMLTSTDGGASFSVRATGVNSAFNQFRTVPGYNGHIWAKAGSSGIWRSTDHGAIFNKLTAVAEVYQFDFGKAKPGTLHPAVFIYGKVGSTVGFFRSDDTGATWTRINDNLHQFGYQNDIAGDPRVYGRLYLATSGRGVVYGDFANPTAPASQSSQMVYADTLESDWVDASPSGTSLTSTNPVRRGTKAISITSGTGKGLSLTRPTNRSLEGFAALAFWVNAGTSAPPPLQVGVSRGGITLEAAPITVPATIGWQRVVVPFTNLGISNITDLTGLRIESRTVNSVTPGAFSLDDVELVGNDEFNGITTATITLTNLEQTYNGTPRPVTATTTPAGLPVLITYNGSSTAPTAVGTYAVSAVIDDSAIIGSATGTLVVAKANASILLGNLTPTADGTPKTPTVTTTPTGLAVSLTYNGSATAPTYAGSYAVVATINDANHQGSTSTTMLIRQLALPATAITGWASNIAGKVSAESSSSPLLNPNDRADDYSTNTLQAFFNPITLANTGDKITLTGGFQLSLAGATSQGNWFRFGLFDNHGQAPTIITAWSGYTGMVTSLQERITGGGGPFSSGADATPRTPDVSPTPVSSNSPSGTPPVIFEETITRTDTGVVLTFLVKRTDTNAVLMSYTYTDTSPNNNGVLTAVQNSPTTPVYTPTYNTAGFAFGKAYISATSGAQAQFSNIQVAFTPGVTAEPQTITFPVIADRTVISPAFDLGATASSGLPVSYQLVSGPATLTGSTLTVTGLGTVTVRATQAGDLTHLPAPDAEQSFNVTKAPATVTLGSLSPTYNGSPKSATATTDPSGKSVVFTYDGGPTAPTNAGSYAVAATINDATYEGSATDTLIIAKAPQAITFNTLSNRTFGDAPFDLSATADSALPVSFSILSGPATLSGNTLTLNGAGTVVVRASQPGDSNHLAAVPVDQSFTVAKATATVTLANLDTSYDGQPKTASVTTTPTGLDVIVTYNGSATPPTLAGSYTVSAIVEDPDYQGSATGTLVIGPRSHTTDLTGWIATTSTMNNANTSSPLWNPGQVASGIAGSAHAFFPAIQLAAVGDSLKLTGLIAIQVSGNTPLPRNNWGLWFRFGLFRNQTPVTSPTDITTNWLGYCGMANGSAALYERIGTGAYASSYTGTVGRTPQAIPANSNTNSSQNSVSLQFTETITRTATGVDVTYHMINTATSATVMAFTYSDDSPNNNGVLTGVQNAATNPIHSPTFSAAGFAFSGEYINSSDTSAQFSNVRVTYTSASEAASQTITFDPLPDHTYGDTPFVINATASSGLPVSYTVVSGPATLSGNSVTVNGVGDVTIRASQAGDFTRLPATPVEQSFTVNKAQAIVTLTNLSHTYDGSAKSATVTTDPANLTVDIRYNGEQTAPYQIDSYEVTAVITDDNYEGAASGTLVINPIPQTITFDPLPDKTYGDTAFALDATASSGLPVSFSIISGPATLDGNTLTLTGAGTVTVRASQSGDATRAPAPDVEQSFTVAKAAATVTLGDLSATYDGDEKPVSTTTTPSGLTVVVTYNGSIAAPSAAGSYAVVANIQNTDYQGTTTDTLVIAQAEQTITFDQPADHTFGDAPFPLSATATSGHPVTFTVVSGPATVSGNTLTLTGAGTVTVRATQPGDSDHLAAPPINQSFSVAKAAAAVTLGDLSATYDGDEKPVSVTTTPSGLTVTVTYNGDIVAPSAAGSYDVVANIQDTDYQGSAADTLVILDAHTALENWRFTHFETYDNSGNAADSADPDSDGIKNLMEFALGLDPELPSTIPATLSVTGVTMEYTYTRLKAAVPELDFIVERSDDLTAWTHDLVVDDPPIPVSGDSTRETIKATIPVGTDRRFIHLKVTPKPVLP